MAYRSNGSGCGCLFVALILFAALVSGIRGCVSGDIKMPKFGSSRVSGGSGGYGTSNGYNVKYKQTTSPNYNSSLNDYTHTNSQPTEYREGTNSQHSNKNAEGNTSSYSSSSNNSSPISGSSSSSISSINTISSSNNVQESKSYYKKCEWCKGTGKREVSEWFYGSVSGFEESCLRCGRTDKHRHDDIITCNNCDGKGRIKMKTINSPIGEIEVQDYDISF